MSRITNPIETPSKESKMTMKTIAIGLLQTCPLVRLSQKNCFWLRRVTEFSKNLLDLALLNYFMDFAGFLEQIGSGLSQSNSNKETPNLQNALPLSTHQRSQFCCLVMHHDMLCGLRHASCMLKQGVEHRGFIYLFFMYSDHCKLIVVNIYNFYYKVVQ
ncbi:uncharacterized protein LOC131238638 [Magnolia sinica]|uniref:uncharacterized protein LOC131238638 n=1 Tax=Magnolia sinica TaxID=86752 RepID=UPI002659EF03|nr:uncharacterized protein LOC131238638 [Magnolia sinica]